MNPHGNQYPEQSKHGEAHAILVGRQADRQRCQHIAQRALESQHGAEVTVELVTVPVVAPVTEPTVEPTPVAPIVERVVQDETAGLTDIRGNVAAAYEG